MDVWGQTNSTERVLMLTQLVDDFPPTVNGEITLPPNTLVALAGKINLQDRALRLSKGTVLRGFGDAQLTSSADGVIRASNVGSNIVMREFSIVSTGGRCLDLTGSIDYQLNVFFLGLIGVGSGTSAGTVNGFDVQAFKDCFINAPDGLTFGGTTNKVFVSQCPFYGITDSAITLAADLNCTVADIVTSFFKFDSPGTGITAESGYTVTDGILRGTLIDGTATPLSGLTPADTNWQMDNNKGIRESRIAGKSSNSTTSTITINSIGTFEDLTDTFTLNSVSERFTLTGSDLEYTGRSPALISFDASFVLDPAQSAEVAVRATKNGTSIADSETVIEQGVGSGSSARAGSVVALISVETGDTIGLALANNTDTTNIDVLRCTMIARG